MTLVWSVQDVYGASINKHCPGSDIILASYWSRAGEVPFRAVHASTSVHYTS
jgi:hypothetical protein